MINYKNKRITIIGSGKTGLSCINFFILKESIVCLMDTRKYPSNINLIPRSIKTYLGELNREYLLKSDLIVLSPGISIHNKDINYAIKSGIEVVSDIEIFCRENETANIIAITGTNGKSTVTSLVYEILKNNGYLVSIGGNIGYPVLNILHKKYDFYVFELSSFQLETTYSLRTISSVILNISDNHLDRHYNINNYLNIKLKIYNNSSYCIINSDNKLLSSYKLSNNIEYEFFGIKNSNYHLNFCKNNSVNLMYKDNLILNSSEIKLFGIHNYLNILSALALTKNINLNLDNKLLTIRNFNSLKHRFNIILNNNNIKWINDSKSTNLISTYCALNSLSNEKGYIHLLLGGIKKSKNFKILTKFFNKNKVKLYCFGKDGIYISKVFYNLYPKYSYNLEVLLFKIFNIIKSGDVVLFSPACSSMDQYKNFEDRGDNFIKLVSKLHNITIKL